MESLTERWPAPLTGLRPHAGLHAHSVAPQRLVACCRDMTLHGLPELGTKSRDRQPARDVAPSPGSLCVLAAAQEHIMRAHGPHALDAPVLIGAARPVCAGRRGSPYVASIPERGYWHHGDRGLPCQLDSRAADSDP